MPSDKKNNTSISVYFIVPAPLTISPGQRFRFEHYLPVLDQQNIHFRVSSFYSLSAWHTLYTSGNKLRKAWCVVSGFTRRITDLFRIRNYSHIYLYREAAPIGPPVFEWIITKLLKKKIIYDFDDAIWIPHTSTYNKAAARLKNFDKVAKICAWSHTVSVGNEYLAAFAGKYNKNVVIIPTVVDTDNIHNSIQQHTTGRPAIGWTGTFSTLPYLEIVMPVLTGLQERYDFDFIVIADKDPQLPLKNYQFVQWNRENEAKDLLRFHIGIMPLYDDEISKGKCGFKAIQYMSLGIPAVVSPVGVNTKIVENEVNGFVCAGLEEWKNRLILLLSNPALRTEFGLAARKRIEDHYSVKATKNLFLALFR